jgi:hypothetical protein
MLGIREHSSVTWRLAGTLVRVSKMNAFGCSQGGNDPGEQFQNVK